MEPMAVPDLLPRAAEDGRTGRAVARLQRHRAFALLWSGATAGRFATEMYGVAVVLFVLAETGSAHLAGLTVAAATFTV